LDVDKKELTKGPIIDMSNGLPFFRFGKDYPIKPITFGRQKEFSARALNLSRTKRIEIVKGAKVLYKYEYPGIANLGRFWVFDDLQIDGAFQDSVLFMYSIRDYIEQDEYYVLRFDVKNNKVIPVTRAVTSGESIISFSSSGLMVYSSAKNGQRSMNIKIVQL